jgi:UDP-N-acetylglucosamine 1-carboxyvinyltransferase
MTLEATRITSTVAPYDLVRKMRASILVLGPMLARMRRGDRVAARRLRHRQPPDRPAPQGAGSASARQIELAAGYVRAIAPDGGCRAAISTSRWFRSARPRMR